MSAEPRGFIAPGVRLCGPLCALGWYCWAADCWKGHPNFGIKLQRHEPYFEGEPRSRYIGGESVLDATRFAAMGAAQRAALAEAGFAPSSALH